jgi:hypothetical protein
MIHKIIGSIDGLRHSEILEINSDKKYIVDWIIYLWKGVLIVECDEFEHVGKRRFDKRKMLDIINKFNDNVIFIRFNPDGNKIVRRGKYCDGHLYKIFILIHYINYYIKNGVSKNLNLYLFYDKVGMINSKSIRDSDFTDDEKKYMNDYVCKNFLNKN